MQLQSAAYDYEAIDLSHVREDAASCRRCALWRTATQTVFGEGPAPAAMMLVGEQPGDKENRAGRPFVGSARLWMTVHPSYLLRLPDETSRQREFVRFVKDLEGAKEWLTERGKRVL